MANVAANQAALDPAIEDAIGDLRARQPRSLARSEMLSSVVLGGGFLLATVLAAVLLPASQRQPDALVVVLLLASYGVAFRLDFEVGTGSAVPTQLVLVPMLFVMPLAWVPALVAGGILVGGAIDYARKEIHLERAFLPLVNGWYVFGPVAVLSAAGELLPHWQASRSTSARSPPSSQSTMRARLPTSTSHSRFGRSRSSGR
jgi:hypothetical protein